MRWNCLDRMGTFGSPLPVRNQMAAFTDDNETKLTIRIDPSQEAEQKIALLTLDQ